VSGFVNVTETSEAGAALAGMAGKTLDASSFEREYGPLWELLDTADARRR
jgi:hypothetical protein